MNARHMEFFEPDLGRGPFSSQRIETSALQIAPPLDLDLRPEVVTVSKAGTATGEELRLLIRSNLAEPLAGEAAVQAPAGWRAKPETISFSLPPTGERTDAA